MESVPRGAPQLSTPDTRILEAPTPVAIHGAIAESRSDEELYTTYEIERTVREIRQERWKRIALQFPDEMLVDAPRIFEALSRGLRSSREGSGRPETQLRKTPGTEDEDFAESRNEIEALQTLPDAVEGNLSVKEKLFILGDTSYGACCVDEIAAEHVDADVVVHYGRSCLSPTSRLPVIYIFTEQKLSLEPVIQAFKDVFPDKDRRVVLVADVTHASHVPALWKALKEDGYSVVYPTSVIHRPASQIPNRALPEPVENGREDLHDYDMFHISEPPTSLLLTLSSRLSSIYFYPTSTHLDTIPSSSLKASTSLALRRRYALLTSLSTASVFGILINTLSVKNYLHIVERVKSQIAAAGKKSYTFVVGKVNAAKIANFSEVGGWVIIGCWESSLVESADFWKPVITPFELQLTLQGDGQRVWSGEWRSDFNDLLQSNATGTKETSAAEHAGNEDANDIADGVVGDNDLDSEPESAPPEFDLRTGRYVSHSRPMRAAVPDSESSASPQDHAPGAKGLVRKAQNGLLAVNGAASPGAEYLQTKRVWKGLGSDFKIAYEEEDDRAGAAIKQGRSGIASGYTVDSDDKR